MHWLDATLLGLALLALVASELLPNMPRRFSQGVALVGFVWLAYSAEIAIEEWSKMRFSLGPRALFLFGAVCIAISLIWHLESRQSPSEELKNETPKVATPKDVGALEAKVIFSTNSPSLGNKLEIGDSGTIFDYRGANGTPLFNFYGSNIVVETINGQVLVSTEIKDQKGLLTATLYRNEWKVAPPPKTWDRNYSKDSLEVIGPEGRVVLQVRALQDRIQLQGEWWGDSEHGIRLVKSNDPARSGAEIIIFGQNRLVTAPDNTEIIKRFVYPSELHLGEIR